MMTEYSGWGLGKIRRAGPFIPVIVHNEDVYDSTFANTKLLLLGKDEKNSIVESHSL